MPLDQIRAALAGRFESLHEASLDGSPVSDDSDRVFFAYRRRPFADLRGLRESSAMARGD